MRRYLAPILTFGILLLAAQPSSAVIIAIDTSGTLLNQSGYFGLSVTTPVSPTGWNDIEFNFFDREGSPTAAGTLYLLSAEYLGTPANLGTAPGTIATSLGIAGGEWFFSPAVILFPSTTYYLYSDARFGSGSISGPSLAVGYYTNSVTSNFSGLAHDAPNYELSGSPVPESGSPVPEPTSMLILGSGLAGLGFLRRRR